MRWTERAARMRHMGNPYQICQKLHRKPVTNPAADGRYYKNRQSDFWYYEEMYSRDIDIPLLYISIKE